MRRVLSFQFPVLRRNRILGRFLSSSSRGLGTCVRQLRNWELKTVLLGVALSVFVPFARGQQVDFAVGGSILWSPKSMSASEAFIPPPEKGGTYGSASLQYLTERRFGLNVEGAFRPKQGLYNGYQHYRPILYDVNAVYAHRFAPKTRGDFMAGIGGQTVLFYGTVNCAYSNGCASYANSTHFLVHAGVGVRYYFWRTFFVRPEAHYYYIHNNFEFHSDNVFRVGASIGHTFGPK
jgi:hypothetical protein